jgi:hypothetical protein
VYTFSLYRPGWTFVQKIWVICGDLLSFVAPCF